MLPPKEIDDKEERTQFTVSASIVCSILELKATLTPRGGSLGVRPVVLLGTVAVAAAASTPLMSVLSCRICDDTVSHLCDVRWNLVARARHIRRPKAQSSIPSEQRRQERQGHQRQSYAWSGTYLRYWNHNTTNTPPSPTYILPVP